MPLNESILFWGPTIYWNWAPPLPFWFILNCLKLYINILTTKYWIFKSLPWRLLSAILHYTRLACLKLGTWVIRYLILLFKQIGETSLSLRIFIHLLVLWSDQRNIKRIPRPEKVSWLVMWNYRMLLHLRVRVRAAILKFIVSLRAQAELLLLQMWSGLASHHQPCKVSYRGKPIHCSSSAFEYCLCLLLFKLPNLLLQFFYEIRHIL